VWIPISQTGSRREYTSSCKHKKIFYLINKNNCVDPHQPDLDRKEYTSSCKHKKKIKNLIKSRTTMRIPISQTGSRSEYTSSCKHQKE
jgi:hypothetical protein